MIVMKRREMIKKTGAALLGASVVGLPAFAQDRQTEVPKKKKVMAIGAHPDDPESCCGGTMLVMKNLGYDVVCLYMTKGEAGIPGKSHDEAAAIRKQEAINACEVMGVKPIFLTQIDGK